MLHQSNCLEAEMVHFIHQMQYYITFEVSCKCSVQGLQLNKIFYLDSACKTLSDCPNFLPGILHVGNSSLESVYPAGWIIY